MTDEFGQTVVNLFDDDGNEHSFEIIDEIEYEGTAYVALMPIIEDADDLADADGQVYIFQSEFEGEEEVFLAVEDDERFNAVYDVFEKRFEKMCFDEDEDVEYLDEEKSEEEK